MAGKSYEMIFQLAAQLSSSFGGTFGKAQQHIANMQKEIVALNKTQGDIQAYQKQQQSIERTKSKLDVLQQQYDNIQREIQETGEFSSDLENKLLSKQQQIDKTSASLNQQTQKLDEMGAALREAGVDTDNLTGESERLAAEIKDLQQQQEAAEEGAGNFGQTAAKAFTAAGSALMAAGIAQGLKEIWQAYMECVRLAADFEETMSTVEALSGATGSEMEMLAAKAKELGASTKFTAEQSAEAMTYMAMAGWDANEMLAGMDGVMSLAAASGEDLAIVSDIVTDNLTAFGLSAADTAHFSDVLAAAATNSNTSVSIMGETFKNSAAIAGALGYSIDDVAVAVGLMANAGVKGSNAGTALKNIFSGLLDGVTLTSSAFGELEYTAMNADGTMKPFSQTINELRGYFDQMTPAEKAANAQAIAGQRAFSGFLSILNATDEDYASLTASIQNCTGAAQKMADIKLDNLNGDLTLLNSAWDALKVTIGEQFNPELRKVVQLGTSVGTMLNDFAVAHPGVVKGIMAFVGVIGAVVAGLTGFVAVTNVVIPLISTLGAAIAAIPGVGPILAVTAGLAALTGVVVGLSTATNDEASEIRTLTEASRQEYEQLQSLQGQYEQAVALYGENSEEALYLAWQIENLTASFESNKQTLADYMAECDELNSSLSEMLTTNRNAFDEIGRSDDTTLALVHRLQELSEQTEQTVATQEEMKAIISALNDTVPDLALSYEEVASGAADYGAAIEATVKAQAAAERYQAAQRGMTDAYNAQTTAQRQLNDLTEQRTAAMVRATEAEQAYLDYLDLIGAAYDSTGGAYFAAMFSDQYKDWQAASAAVQEYDAQLEETQAVLDQATTEYESFKAELVDYAEETYGAGDATDDVTGAINEAIAAARELAAAYEEAYAAALDSISGQYSLWDEADTVVATSADSINAALESQAQYWADYNTNLQSLSARTGDIEGLSDVIASFADGSTASVNAIAGMANASDADLKKMVANWQQVQSQQSEAASSLADLETEFSSRMAAIQASVESSVAGMNCSGEAAAAAIATMNSFMNSASSQSALVNQKFRSIGEAAVRELEQAATVTFTVTTSGGGSRVPGHAAGTPSAAKGYALVGEEGPELVYFNGGETVKTASETQQILGLANDQGIAQIVGLLPQFVEVLRAYEATSAVMPTEATGASGGVYAPVSVQVTFQIDGNASGETVDALSAYGDDFAERVLDVIETANADAARGGYV